MLADGAIIIQWHGCLLPPLFFSCLFLGFLYAQYTYGSVYSHTSYRPCVVKSNNTTPLDWPFHRVRKMPSLLAPCGGDACVAHI
ncbi:hypothetical protein EI94DRAFT_1735278, partial [Lactarius quietus]